MNEEQFRRANEIVKRVKYLAEKRDQLKTIEKRGAHKVEIKTYHEGAHVYFKLDNNPNGEHAIEHQPSSVPVLLEAFIQTCVSVYQREIDDLESEFKKL